MVRSIAHSKCAAGVSPSSAVMSTLWNVQLQPPMPTKHTGAREANLAKIMQADIEDWLPGRASPSSSGWYSPRRLGSRQAT